MKLGFLTKNKLVASRISLIVEGNGYYDDDYIFHKGEKKTYNNLLGTVSKNKNKLEHSIVGTDNKVTISVSFDNNYMLKPIYDDGLLLKHGDIIVYKKDNYTITSAEPYEEHNFINVKGVMIDG